MKHKGMPKKSNSGKGKSYDGLGIGAWGSDDVPSLGELMQWESEGGCYTPCGCWVEPDGHCPHGKDSWLLILGLI